MQPKVTTTKIKIRQRYEVRSIQKILAEINDRKEKGLPELEAYTDPKLLETVEREQEFTIVVIGRAFNATVVVSDEEQAMTVQISGGHSTNCFISLSVPDGPEKIAHKSEFIKYSPKEGTEDHENKVKASAAVEQVFRNFFRPAPDNLEKINAFGEFCRRWNPFNQD